MLDPVPDASALRVATFSPQSSLSGMLAAFPVPTVRVPAEVYNGDEDADLSDSDIRLSVLAREIRARRHRLTHQHWTCTQREHTALRRAIQQLQNGLTAGHLTVDYLRPTDIPRREQLRNLYGLGRGEAASLVLAENSRAVLVFATATGPAFEAACIEHLNVIAIRSSLAA